MNKRPNSNLSGRLVPIFANNKKKRLKQALYANPTTDDFVEQTTTGKDFFETKKTGPQQRSCPSPQRLNSTSNDGVHNSLSVTRQSQYQTRVRGGRGGITNLPSPSGNHTENNQGGSQNRTPVKEEQQRFQNTGNVLSRATTTIKSSRVRSSQHHSEKDAAISFVKKEKGEAGERKPTEAKTSLSTFQSFQPDDRQLKSKEESTKQVNLMAAPTDKSLKVITASIQDVLQWNQFEDKITAIYEIFGTLDSQVSLNQAGNGKNFIIKDKTANLRCIFWEMDRQLPRLTRGQIHRCVGSLDRKNGHFNCVSVRPANQTELQGMATFLKVSQLAMQEQLAYLKED